MRHLVAHGWTLPPRRTTAHRRQWARWQRIRAAVQQSPWPRVQARERAARSRHEARERVHVDARAAADAQHWAEWHEALDAAVAAGDDELAWQLRTGHESVQEAAPRQLRTDAELDAVEAAIEAREAAIEAREERRVLFDVLQPGWSDSTFSAEWARLEEEEEEEACAEDGLTVVGTEDRFEDFVGL